MKGFLITISTFLSGFLLYFAWTGFVEEELKITEHRGRIVNKIRSEQVIDFGTAMTVKPQYKVVLSTGETLNVPFPVYQKLNKGEFTILLKQNDRIINP
ncbi:hypothetical protein [Fictibacillus phosphorivorans]|uniref:hypothetical protein n=1 Tax=Fictibacillus phosphorivorans TaxID=1221500 RepID=UPI00203A6E83|nr:hypothetical protein [Fictibacillus phosphorivorans]MCM3719346.1 hypothetical protein [Fictibacillus phosphorivorans]MCM3776967.1 hypothetical protein [Fictibacillus phosphorivorans]